MDQEKYNQTNDSLIGNREENGESIGEERADSLKEWATVKPFNQNETSSGEMGEPEGTSFFAAIYGVFFQPIITFRELGVSGRLWWGLLAYFFIILFDQVASIIYGDSGWDYLVETWGLAFAGFAGLAFLPLIFACVFVFIAIIHACASLLGGKGLFRGFFTASAFAAFPIVIIRLLEFAEGLGGFLLESFVILLQLAVSLWVLVLQLLAVRECYRVSTGKAVAIYFLPLIYVLISILWTFGWGVAMVPNWYEIMF